MFFHHRELRVGLITSSAYRVARDSTLPVPGHVTAARRPGYKELAPFFFSNTTEEIQLNVSRVQWLEKLRVSPQPLHHPQRRFVFKQGAFASLVAF